MPGLPYGVVETRGNTLSVSNDPVPGHHTRGDRHESRSGLPRTPFFTNTSTNHYALTSNARGSSTHEPSCGLKQIHDQRG